MPDFRDPQRRVNAEHLLVLVRDLHLDGEVGGRIDVEVDLLGPDQGLVGQVECSVRFLASLRLLPE
jgi:hypothetical protein